MTGSHFNQIRVGIRGGGNQHGMNIRVVHRFIQALLARLIVCRETSGKFLIRSTTDQSVVALWLAMLAACTANSASAQ
jgi:hypothetical protein